MNARTKLSAKGQVVIPKRIRAKMGLDIGDSFEVITRGDELILRREPSVARLSPLAALALIRKVVRYDGPLIPIEHLSWHPVDGDEQK